MDKKYYTLFVLTNDASKTRQYKVPVRLFKACAGAAVFVTLIFAFMVFDYARLKGDSIELAKLKKENTAQKIELQGFASKIGDIEDKLAKLNIFDKKLRIIANLEEPKALAQTDQVKGLGGGASPDEPEYFSTPGAKVKTLVNQMHSDLRQVENQAMAQETSFTELQESLMKKSGFLSSTPSIWPSRGWVTSTFGERVSPFTGFPQLHRGIDIANRVGTPVVAPADGVVVQVLRDGGLGKMVSISHGYGVKTTYGHLSEIFVRVGQRVKRGAKVASMGNTGHSTGPHLHYEVSANGVSVNPEKYLLN